MYLRGLSGDELVIPSDFSNEEYTGYADAGYTEGYADEGYTEGYTPLSIPSDFYEPSVTSAPSPASGDSGFNWSSLLTSAVNAYGKKQSADQVKYASQIAVPRQAPVGAPSRYSVRSKSGSSPFPSFFAQSNAPMGSNGKTLIALGAIGAIAFYFLRK